MAELERYIDAAQRHHEFAVKVERMAKEAALARAERAEQALEVSRINREAVEEELAALRAGLEELADRAMCPTLLGDDVKVVPRWMIYEVRDRKAKP